MKKLLARTEKARRDWLTNNLTPEQISAKYKVSLSTAYRWIKYFESREGH